MTHTRDAVVATSNTHKVTELAAALPGWRLEPLSGGGLPVEDGSTYADNARSKARFGRERVPSTAWVLGEDSGIEVAALDGRPGVHSARWAHDGVARLLAELDGVADRRARYRCFIVAISPDRG